MEPILANRNVNFVRTLRNLRVQSTRLYIENLGDHTNSCAVHDRFGNEKVLCSEMLVHRITRLYGIVSTHVRFEPNAPVMMRMFNNEGFVGNFQYNPDAAFHSCFANHLKYRERSVGHEFCFLYHDDVQQLIREHVTVDDILPGELDLILQGLVHHELDPILDDMNFDDMMDM